MLVSARTVLRLALTSLTLIVLAALPMQAQAVGWLPHSLVFPPGITNENLNGISCATGASSCLAVGQDFNGVGGAHAEIGAGSGWTAQSTVVRNPGPKNGAFLGASCVTTTTTCVAVGQWGTSSGGQQAMAQEPATPTWSLQTPSAGGRFRFNAVSCTNPTAGAWCMAVGFQNTSSTLAMTASGPSFSTWTNASAPAGTVLNGVSCVEKATGGHWCMAVGSSGSAALVEVYDAGTWSTLAAPAVGTTSYPVYGVSCRSERWCAITGDLNGGGTHNAIVQIWNGSTWTSPVLPTKPSGTTQSVGYGISCVSTTECYAVGEGNTPGPQPWAAKWDGTRWASQTATAAPGATGATLRGVSCPATNHCEAAGWSLFSGTPTGLIETYI
ncbi:hypothetical protein [Conexibacter woesei]|uniref:hypothetical protein n=1 Tax=Conexibacter woesei TaxID=191495 RepID=UPI000403BCD6|nr:hypothetical protein [Conexibacter woesei]